MDCSAIDIITSQYSLLITTSIHIVTFHSTTVIEKIKEMTQSLFRDIPATLHHNGL